MKVGDKKAVGLCVIERLDDDLDERLYEVWLPYGFNGDTIHSAIEHGMKRARESAEWYSDPDNLYRCTEGGGCGCGIDLGDDPQVEVPPASGTGPVGWLGALE